MSSDDTVFISQALAAASFYWGLLGGLVALALARVLGLLARVVYRAVRRV